MKASREPTLAEGAMFFARQAALASVTGRCGTGLNSVVLPGSVIGREGWLVYILQGSNRPDDRILGGHRRFLVSLDGKQVLEEKPLSKGCLVTRASEVPDGAKSVGLSVTTLVSDVPLETHVFSSLSYRTPVWVATSRQTWKVDGDHITAGAEPLKVRTTPCGLDLQSTDLGARQLCCESGDVEQCRALAKVYELGKTVLTDVARAAELTVLAQATTLKVSPGCAHCDACKETEACRQLCETNPEDAYACFLVAKRYFDGGEKERAAQYNERACSKDIAPGCAMAGTLYMGTLGLPADATRAARFLGRGRELDDPAACGTAGLLYVSGQLFQKDETRGARMLGKACALNYTQAARRSGRPTRTGRASHTTNFERRTPMQKPAREARTTPEPHALAIPSRTSTTKGSG